MTNCEWSGDQQFTGIPVVQPYPRAGYRPQCGWGVTGDWRGDSCPPTLASGPHLRPASLSLPTSACPPRRQPITAPPFPGMRDERCEGRREPQRVSTAEWAFDGGRVKAVEPGEGSPRNAWRHYSRTVNPPSRSSGPWRVNRRRLLIALPRLPRSAMALWLARVWESRNECWH